MKYQIGDYVQVVRVPDPWDGSGESEEDRRSYVDHVGIVAELEEDFLKDEQGNPIDMLLVRFPCSVHDWEYTTQRNIESTSVRLISRPDKEIDQELFG